MTKNTVNARDGVERIFRGLGRGATGYANASPLIPKLGKSTKKTITGRN